MAFELLEGVIPKEFLAFIKKQINLSLKNKHGKRYDNAYKAWALTLYHVSGKAYRFLAKMFHLPSKPTLTKIVSRFASDVGFSEKSLFVLRQGVEIIV